jgi:UDP-galactose transporter
MTFIFLGSVDISIQVMKFIVCNAVVFFQLHSSFRAYWKEIYGNTWMTPMEVVKVSVPSFLYVLQNNLLYLALSNLDAATYQVCYQLKILTTALFSATMLQRKFSRTKWFSLVLLTIGVAIVQTSGDTQGGGKEASSEGGMEQNRAVGLFAILCAACTSGFSGVYFEKILKGSSTSLWIRNIQMGLPSIIISLLTVYIEDGRVVAEKGFFVGYSHLVWLVVVVQAVGGLIVAVVVKYADNVLKTFASSFGIVISCIVSAFFFNFRPNFAFLCGSSLVVLSTVLYSKPEKRQRRRLKATVLPK